MTLAPELPGAVELAAHATARGVRVSVGHSNATAAETRAAIAAGAVSATHTFNAMRPLDHREPGILGIVLTDDRLYAELICDGIHTAPEMVKLWWRAKGEQRAILVTDAMSATGMPDGEYQLGGFPVQVANGRATARGVLAGSVLTLDRALSNFVRVYRRAARRGPAAAHRKPRRNAWRIPTRRIEARRIRARASPGRRPASQPGSGRLHRKAGCLDATWPASSGPVTRRLPGLTIQPAASRATQRLRGKQPSSCPTGISGAAA